MTATDQLLVVGLPRAGKTTFIAALWNALESGATASMSLGSVRDQDQAYLNKIRDLWIRCEELPKTSTGDEQSLVVPVVLDSGGSKQTRELLLPDLSGEGFESQWITRHCSAEYGGMAGKCGGCLLFINPLTVVEPTTIAEVVGALPEATEGTEPAVPWDPAHAPTQVVLVDVLQSLRFLNGGGPMRVCVIVSAWDVEAARNPTPDSWMSKRVPLLAQFLNASRDLTVQVYGVSAQGGALANRASLLGMDPAQRVTVWEGDQQYKDIARPLAWLMEGA
jgi:hypothetical protein